MSCEEFFDSLDATSSGSLPESARAHMSQCSSCSSVWSEWRLLRSGFLAIAQEDPPAAQFGFAARVLRRLEDAGDTGRTAAQLFEVIGRRFVLAELLLVMLLILGMFLPASSPIRGAAFDEPYLAQAEPGPRTDVSPFGYEAPESATNPNVGGNQAPK